MFHIKRSGLVINRELLSNWRKKKGILGLARDNLWQGTGGHISDWEHSGYADAFLTDRICIFKKQREETCVLNCPLYADKVSCHLGFTLQRGHLRWCAVSTAYAENYYLSLVPSCGGRDNFAYKCECGGPEKTGKMGKLLQARGCISSVGGFSSQTHLYKLFIRFLIYYCERDHVHVCECIHSVYMHMCAHANGSQWTT